MKKAALVFILALIPLNLPASGNFSLWGGYSYSFPSEVNAELDAINNSYNPRGAKPCLGGGIAAGLDGAWWYYSWWGIGGRISYTKLFDASASGEEGIFAAETKMGGSLCQVTAGVPYLFEFFDGAVSFGGGFYGGWGYAALSIEKTGGTPGTAGLLKAGGHCFVFEAPVRLTYHISSSFLVDFDFSWKSTSTAGLNVYETSGGAATDFSAGDSLPYGMDFSGFMIGIGVNWRFSSKDWPWYNKKFSFSE